MLNQLFFEKNLVHNFIWNRIQQDGLINSCLHWPTFVVSPCVRRLCNIESKLSKRKKYEIEVVTMDILKSGNIIDCFTMLCNEIFANISNAHLTALIYVSSELAKHFIKSHDIIQINCIINVLQFQISSSYKQKFRKIGWVCILLVFTALTFAILPHYKQHSYI